jgi:hypothetical protein
MVPGFERHPDDIVAELVRWMHLYDSGLSNQPPTGSGRWLIERARDEIVALRKAYCTELAATNEAISRATKEAYALGRAEERERLARYFEGCNGDMWLQQDIADSIRFSEERTTYGDQA